ncbi:unnamed protein product [Rotaria sordida]|uniref:F-box domain-containing protein n=1 Tax=Rotaria sordida TaxID=392033 RepID=A0A815CF79_9BILA|nr:unnamed protein product [Rotaria sordida]CAF1282820.1 unnamed protein product [Rotaria sordida]CAF3711157.1 unnamed protein product [Rotaria sordida]CAF3948528.1 unnamed protein product [Rotaria sordida]
MAPSTTFETLPDEIILIACQYLRGADVLYSFYNLNTRLNITITGYCRYVNLMTVPYKFVWKEKVEALNSLKIVGSIELQERPNEEVLTKIIDYTIGEMETLKAGNEQKISEIQRINSQLNKALEVNNMKRSLFYNN